MYKIGVRKKTTSRTFTDHRMHTSDRRGDRSVPSNVQYKSSF